MNLDLKVSTGNRSLKMYASRLQKLEIVTYRDLLYHIPLRYENYTLITPMSTVQEGELVTVQGAVTEAKNSFTRSHKSIQKITITDQSGTIDLVWFNQPYIVKNFSVGDLLSISGKVEIFSRKRTLISPEYELLNNPRVHTGRIIPIYPETRGVTSKWLRKQISLLLTEIDGQLEDLLPSVISSSHSLMNLKAALSSIHFPDSMENVENARHRLAFDEVFFIQMLTEERKKQWSQIKNGKKLTISDKQLLDFTKSLPFELTRSQHQAIGDIRSDLARIKPMNRLLQGDVGSGKTVVAALAMYTAALNGFQSAIMAPTEILAQQHHNTLTCLLSPFGIKVGLVTSSSKYHVASSKKNKNKSDKLHTTNYQLPTTDVVVGTHALVAKNLNFTRLGFVAIDEQQRFGVTQRGILREKGESPHILTMTATPIPRTMALTLYGELDASYLTDMPKGRRVIKTWLVPEEKRSGAYEWIEKQVKEDSQIFIICPFIEESENMQTVKAASLEFERLKTDIFPHLRLGLLHGKLKSKEKDLVLAQFREKKFDILVATPVVEVGIDIPNATTIVIEGSERFGLAQLHQLRGRVGRGDKQSYCLLFTGSDNPTAITRLKAMETMSSGAVLAEFDLKMRGPGQMYGLAQSGTRMLKIASFSDFKLLDQAKKAAVLISQDLAKYPRLAEMIASRMIDTVTPD